MPTIRQLRKSLSSAPEGFEAIAGVVKKQLSDLEKFFVVLCAEIEPQVRDLVRYCLKHQGKRLRPILVFFSGARSAKGRSEPLVRLAATIELLHLATLVHDDVMDGATLRHGYPTLNAANGPVVAVLLGDAMFARALELMTDFDVETICKPLTQAARRVCAGEIWQTTERGNAAISIDEYFQMIEMKTGELFRVSCLLGARVGGHTEAVSAAFAEFGRRLGRAYQVYDDLADILGEEVAIGKTLGTDLTSGKYTLPALLLLKELPAKARRELSAQIRENRIDAPALGRQIVEAKILDKVVAYFRAEIAAGQAALAPYRQLFAAENLLKMADFVNAQFERFLKKKGA